MQELLLRVGVLGHLVPLLFGYDATHDSGSQPDYFDYSGAQKAQGPAFLGLGIQRSNMQVCCSFLYRCREILRTAQLNHDRLTGFSAGF